MDILALIAAFGGGIIGAYMGALPAFIMTGIYALVGGVLTAAGVGGDVAVNYLAFGSFVGPHIAFAGGVGSMLADLLSGYAYYAPGTLVIKALVALVAALVFQALRNKYAILVELAELFDVIDELQTKYSNEPAFPPVRKRQQP